MGLGPRNLTTTGYSARTANVIGYENLTKPHIAAAIATAQKERSERLQVTADDVVRELALHGFGTMRDFFNDEGNLLDVNELSATAASRLSSIEVLRERTRTTSAGKNSVQTLEQTIKVKMWDTRHTS